MGAPPETQQEWVGGKGREVEMEKLCNEKGGGERECREERESGGESLMITEKRKEEGRGKQLVGKEGEKEEQGRKRKWTERGKEEGEG